jgi:hypothetical protein
MQVKVSTSVRPGLEASQATRLGIAMTIAAFLILVPLDYGWWRLIGAL